MNLRKRNKLVFGFGVNDADYLVRTIVDGKDIICPFYRSWSAMLGRCYGADAKNKRKSYGECTVCDEWLTFSNFKAWMEQQDWEGKELDKDFILIGNRQYSKEACAFITSMTNTFIVDRSAARGLRMIGVLKNHKLDRFYARCSNPFSGKNEYLGAFSAEIDAHLAWKKRKHELACQLADLQTDERVANALRTRYL